MAEFKTAEQYVVEKLEMMEREREEIELQHTAEILELKISLDAKREELGGAYELLNMLRDFIEVRYDNYFGNYIRFENIYSKENPEAVARLMEYFDIRPEEDEEDE